MTQLLLMAHHNLPSSLQEELGRETLYLSIFFIICAKALTSLLINVELFGYIFSFPLGRSPLKVSHLLFANDNILFCKTNSTECSRMLFLLETYENASAT